MTESKVMNFNEFSKNDPLQKPETALKGDNVDPKKKEKFVDQVKFADLTKLDVNQPDYSKVDEDAGSDVANLQSDITNLERQIIEFEKTSAEKLNQMKTDLQTKREALHQAMAQQATTNTTTVAQAQKPAEQPSTVVPGQTPAQPTI